MDPFQAKVEVSLMAVNMVSYIPNTRYKLPAGYITVRTQSDKYFLIDDIILEDIENNLNSLSKVIET